MGTEKIPLGIQPHESEDIRGRGQKIVNAAGELALEPVDILGLTREEIRQRAAERYSLNELGFRGYQGDI